MGRLAALVLAVLVGACALAPWYAAHVSGMDPFRTNVLGALPDGAPVLAAQELGVTPAGPTGRGAYLLGADGLGRDVAARLLYGGRVSLGIAFVATVLCLVLSTVLGVSAGFLAGPADAVIAAPLHPYAEGLMASVPARNRPGERLRQIPGGMPGLGDMPEGCSFRPRCPRADAACRQAPELAEPLPGRQARCVHPLLPC